MEEYKVELENFFGSDRVYSDKITDNKQLLPLHHHLHNISIHTHYLPHNMSAEKKGRTIFIGNIPYGPYSLCNTSELFSDSRDQVSPKNRSSTSSAQLAQS